MARGVNTEEIEYEVEGASVKARLYSRVSSSSNPGILLCPGRLRDISGLEFLSRSLAARGYVVLATTYRGMDFFSDDRDAIAGLDALQQLDGVEGGRLGIIGHSRGGMCGLRTAALDERVRSLVALAPPTEFASYVRAMKLLSPVRYAAMIKSMGGTPVEQVERYRQISAVNYAEHIHCPVLLVCGTQDLHAPLDHSKLMYDELVRAGNSLCRLEVLEGVGHFFERMYFGYIFDEVAEMASNWFEETLADNPKG